MTTRRKYTRVTVEQARPEENVIRVTARATASTLVRRALWLFQGSRTDNQPPHYDTIIITAIENAIPKAVIISEVIRRRIADLHQVMRSLNL